MSLLLPVHAIIIHRWRGIDIYGRSTCLRVLVHIMVLLVVLLRIRRGLLRGLLILLLLRLLVLVLLFLALWQRLRLRRWLLLLLLLLFRGRRFRVLVCAIRLGVVHGIKGVYLRGKPIIGLSRRRCPRVRIVSTILVRVGKK